MSSSHGLEAKTDSTRRKLVLAACHTCRRRKAKCDGQRPACHLCQESGFDCTYDTLPEESRSGALKRKYAELEQKAKTQQELLDVLQGASEEEAARAFQQIRQGQGHDRVLASFTERNSRHGLNDNPKRSFEDSSQAPSVAASTSGLETGRQHSGLLAPRVNTVQGGPHTKPLGRGDPTRDLVRFRSHDGSTATPARTARASTSLRAKPLPEGIDRVQSKETIEPKSPGCRNKDLRSVQARDWGVSYTDTRNLILMLDHYFLWEHYSYHFFDENAFWEGLAAGGSEFCNKLLVHSIVAYTARSYQNFGPGQGDAAAHFALVEAKKIWEVEVANEIPANIAAGLLIHCVHGLNGLDQIAHHYIIQACRMAENAGFFSSRSRSQSRRQIFQSGKEKETSESSGKEFARTMSAWGVFSHQAFYCMVLNIRSFLTRPPPFDPPSNRMDTAYEPEYPQNPAAFLALTTRRFNARAKLYTILNNVVPSHKDFDSDFGSKDHLDATMCMFRSLLEWRGMLHYSLCPTETSPQHIFVLHFEYHRAIIDLFRPFVKPDETVKPALGSLRKDATLEQALDASETSLHSLIWLLRTFEKRYSGRPIHVNLISPLLLVSYETISTLATEHSATDNYRATLIFCAHMLRYMAKVHPIAGLILRSLEQVTSRYDVPLPAEIYGMIEDLDKQDAYMADVNKVHSGLPIDLGRMHTADGSDQLGHLVRKMADADLND